MSIASMQDITRTKQRDSVQIPYTEPALVPEKFLTPQKENATATIASHADFVGPQEWASMLQSAGTHLVPAHYPVAKPKHERRCIGKQKNPQNTPNQQPSEPQ